jgi:AraC-like DNA-binding protein
MHELRTVFRYPPVCPENQAWGAYLLTAGFALIPPGLSYPPARHPAHHHFAWEQGRVLLSHQILYIARGTGVLESKRSGLQAIKAGDLFIIYPEEWHRYRPNADSGWDEYWIEPEGDYIRRLMKHPALSPDRPVHHIGIHSRLLDMFGEAVEVLRRKPPEYQILAGGLAVDIIAHTLSALRVEDLDRPPVEQVIQEAKRMLLRPGNLSLPLESHAARFGMSYSTFRHYFKAQTGLSPRQFALECLLQQAKDLLQDTNLPVGVIADKLGFKSVNYFSRFIKQRTGLSPNHRRGNCGDAPSPP